MEKNRIVPTFKATIAYRIEETGEIFLCDRKAMDWGQTFIRDLLNMNEEVEQFKEKFHIKSDISMLTHVSDTDYQFKYKATNVDDEDDIYLLTDEYDDIISLLEERPHLYMKVDKMDEDGYIEDTWRVWCHKITKKVCEG